MNDPILIAQGKKPIYLLPQMELCASCPLVSHEERFARNLEWLKTRA